MLLSVVGWARFDVWCKNKYGRAGPGSRFPIRIAVPCPPIANEGSDILITSWDATRRGHPPDMGVGGLALIHQKRQSINSIYQSRLSVGRSITPARQPGRQTARQPDRPREQRGSTAAMAGSSWPWLACDASSISTRHCSPSLISPRPSSSCVGANLALTSHPLAPGLPTHLLHTHRHTHTHILTSLHPHTLSQLRRSQQPATTRWPGRGCQQQAARIINSRHLHHHLAESCLTPSHVAGAPRTRAPDGGIRAFPRPRVPTPGPPSTSSACTCSRGGVHSLPCCHGTSLTLTLTLTLALTLTLTITLARTRAHPDSRSSSHPCHRARPPRPRQYLPSPGPSNLPLAAPKAAPKPLINSRLLVVSHMRLCSIPQFPASAARIDVYCAGSPSLAYPFHHVHRPTPPPPSYPTSSAQIHRTALTAAQIKKNNSKLQRQLTPSRRSGGGPGPACSPTTALSLTAPPQKCTSCV